MTLKEETREEITAYDALSLCYCLNDSLDKSMVV